eukprot:jgi/Psemu1/34265/gm1.34265_g
MLPPPSLCALPYDHGITYLTTPPPSSPPSSIAARVKRKHPKENSHPRYYSTIPCKERGISLGIHLLSPTQQAQLFMGAIGSPGSAHKFCTAPCGTCAVVKHRSTKFNLEPLLALTSGTYLFIETKPGVLSAMICLPVEVITDGGTSLEQWLSQHHTFDQWEARQGVISGQCLHPTSLLLEPKAKQAKLDLIETQVEEQYPELKLLTVKVLEPMNLTNLKAAFGKELDLSSIDLQDYLDTLMETDAKFTEGLGKLKAQPLDLAKAKQDKLSTGIHTAIMASLGAILEFIKACSTQTPGGILSDRISRLESTAATPPSSHLPIAHSPAKLASMTDLQVQLNALEAQFTSFRKASDNTKVRLMNTYFTSRTDVGAWCTLHANNSAGYLHVGGTNSNISFESYARKSGYGSPKAALVMKSFRYAVRSLDDVAETIRQEAAINISMEENWQYVSHYVRAIFEHLHKARKARVKLGGRHVALEFTQDGFSNHLEVQTVLTKHMLHQAVIGQGPQEGLNTPVGTKWGTKKATPSLGPVTDSHQDQIKTNDGQSVYPPQPEPAKPMRAECVEVTLEKSTKSVGVVSETYPTWLRYVGSWTNALGKKQKQTPGFHDGTVPLGWKKGSTWFSHIKLGGIKDGCFLVEWAKTKYTTNLSKTFNRRVNWIHNECILDALINHKTPVKVFSGAGRATELTAAIRASYKQDTHGVVEVMDLEIGFDAKPLKDKLKIAPTPSWTRLQKAANLVESLEHKVASGVILIGLEVFVFTDNFMVESTMYKGSSLSELLHNMVALEQLCKVQHAFPYSRHVFVRPTLMMGVQRKQLSKAADAQITFVNRSTIWPKEMLQGTSSPFLSPRDLDNCLIDHRLMKDKDTQIFKNPLNGCPINTLRAKFIQRATLDAFWSREWSTVAKNRRELTRYSDFQVNLGTDLSCLPPQGLIPTEDSWGMRFETIRKFHSAFTNFVHTCPEGVGACLTLQGRGSCFVSPSLANSLWFNCFTTKYHCRTGDVWLPDAQVTLEIMDAALDYMEEKWEAMEDLTSQEMFSFASCADKEDGTCCVPLTLTGTFKNQSYLMFSTHPLTPRMRIYGEMANISTGPLFKNKEQNWRATIADLDGPFHDILKVVQCHHVLLNDSTMVVKDLYSAYRSFRRGAASAAQNTRLDATTISANNYWRSQASSSGTGLGNMLHRYSTAMSNIWDYINKLLFGYFTYRPTFDKGLCGIPHPTETLRGWWTTSSSTRHHERPIEILTTVNNRTLLQNEQEEKTNDGDVANGSCLDNGIPCYKNGRQLTPSQLDFRMQMVYFDIDQPSTNKLFRTKAQE